MHLLATKAPNAPSNLLSSTALRRKKARVQRKKDLQDCSLLAARPGKRGGRKARSPLFGLPIGRQIGLGVTQDFQHVLAVARCHGVVDIAVSCGEDLPELAVHTRLD